MWSGFKQTDTRNIWKNNNNDMGVYKFPVIWNDYVNSKMQKKEHTQSEAFRLHTQPALPAFQDSDTEYKPFNTDI